ncbi:MAG: glycerophosphodiester phosphodiesterase [Acidobacteria bacterium]|nr:glycerophosphodiester phosphodiesterase [Acidobacteriota bacterium]
MRGPRGFLPAPVFAAGRPLVFGHRGGARLGPENTLTAFRRAMAAGADGFECDVRLSADAVPVVIHDPTLERTTDATGPVHTRTADQLGRVDARCRFVPAEPAFAVAQPEGVPTLQAALTRFPGARVIIEIKDESTRLAEIVASLVSALGAAPRVCIGSFHQAVLDRVREVAPDLTTSASLRESQWTLALSWLRWPFAARPPYRAFQVPERSGRLPVVGPAFVRRAHRERASVQVWTIDAPEDVRRLLALGVDGIISDRPDLAVGARDAFVAASSGPQ